MTECCLKLAPTFPSCTRRIFINLFEDTRENGDSDTDEITYVTMRKIHTSLCLVWCNDFYLWKFPMFLLDSNLQSVFLTQIKREKVVDFFSIFSVFFSIWNHWGETNILFKITKIKEQGSNPSFIL